jgi:hypothetical protein
MATYLSLCSSKIPGRIAVWKDSYSLARIPPLGSRAPRCPDLICVLVRRRGTGGTGNRRVFAS